MTIELCKKNEENEYLTNYSSYGFYKNDIFYKTVEHFYQSEKIADKNVQEKIINSNTPFDASAIGRDRKNIRKKNFKNLKKKIMLEGILEKFKQNKEILHKLIETRNEEIIAISDDEYYWGIGKDKSGENNFGKILMEVRRILKTEIIQNIINECKQYEVYILGHKNPDADSIFSSFILNNVLKSLGCKSHFCILNNEYDYAESDKKIILDFLPEQPEIISSVENKKFILVDHNNLDTLSKENIIAAIDHHMITGEIENIIEMEYSSTGLLIYDLFKDYYNFTEQEKLLVGLTVMTDTEYLCSSRFTDEDRKIYKTLNLNINEKYLQKKYFSTTIFSEDMNSTINNNLKKYNYNNKYISRVLISTYTDDFNLHFKEYCKIIDSKVGNWLLIWCNYELKKTIIYYNKNKIELNYITTSTYIVFKELEKSNLI